MHKNKRFCKQTVRNSPLARLLTSTSAKSLWKQYILLIIFFSPLSVYLSVCLSTCLYVCLPVCMSVSPSSFLSTDLCISLPPYPPSYLSTCLSPLFFLSTHPSVCLSSSLPSSLSLLLPICPSFLLPLYPSLALSPPSSISTSLSLPSSLPPCLSFHPSLPLCFPLPPALTICLSLHPSQSLILPLCLCSSLLTVSDSMCKRIIFKISIVSPIISPIYSNFDLAYILSEQLNLSTQIHTLIPFPLRSLLAGFAWWFFVQLLESVIMAVLCTCNSSNFWCQANALN